MRPESPVEIVHLFDSPAVRRLVRIFDVGTALTGLAVLIILGPVALYQAVTSPVPLKGELTPIEGVALACKADIRGALVLVRLAGGEQELRSQLDSCGKLSPETPGHGVRVTVYVLPVQLNPARGRSPIPAFGVTADGEVMHELDADLTAARLDRVVLTILGIVATMALGWLGWVAASAPSAVVQLFTGRAANR